MNMNKKLIWLIVFWLGSPLVAHGFFLIWPEVTTYTDGSNIETTIMYDAWVDNVPLAVGVQETRAPLTDNTFGATHEYKVRTTS